MDYLSLIDKYYGEEESLLKTILLRHSYAVARKALQIAEAHPEMHLDKAFLEEAAMLHDIGIIRCDAPGIECHGTQPYICHGRIGAEMMRQEGLLRHARVCERHTGAGLSRQEIIQQNLPLPEEDFLPETMEEQVICYADKFFSKTRLDEEKSLEHVERSLARFGEDGLERFRQWNKMFS